MSSIEERLTALEAQVNAPRPQSPLSGYAIPEGWLLVESTYIPWSDDIATWDLYDANDPDYPWECDLDAQPPFPTLVVVRPKGDAS